MEKLSSLCVRFMPTFVSPATSIRSGPPKVAEMVTRSRPPVNEVEEKRWRLPLDPSQPPLTDGGTFRSSGRGRRRLLQVGRGGRRSCRGHAQHDRYVAELLVAKHEELHRVAGAVLADGLGQGL